MQNADIAEVQVMVLDVFIHRLACTNIATMRSTVNGAARRAMARAAIIRPRKSIATALAATSASGAAQPPTVAAAFTAQPVCTRSER